MGTSRSVRPVRPGNHPNWCRCPGCRADIAQFESRQWKGTLIAGAVVVTTGLVIALGKLLAHSWHEWALLTLLPVAALLVYLGLRATRETPGEALDRVRADEALEIASRLAESPPVPEPPACRHPNAVRVESTLSPQVTLENWCTDCETSLGAGFRWPCCSARPGSSPGAGHVYNCPHRKR